MPDTNANPTTRLDTEPLAIEDGEARVAAAITSMADAVAADLRSRLPAAALIEVGVDRGDTTVWSRLLGTAEIGVELSCFEPGRFVFLTTDSRGRRVSLPSAALGRLEDCYDQREDVLRAVVSALRAMLPEREGDGPKAEPEQVHVAYTDETDIPF